MPEPITEIKPVDNGQPTTPPVTPEVDIVTRVSQVKPPETPANQPSDSFNVQDIDSIQDPAAKEYAQKAYKSFQADYTRKTQALAEEKKLLVDLKKTYDAGQANDIWTPERVSGLLKDPTFIAAAQSVPGVNQPSDDGSMLSEAEKQKVTNAENLARQALQTQNHVLKMQQDEANTRKYANYNAGAVDDVTTSLIQNKRQATREDLWKVIDYEPAVKRAYALGLQDKEVNNQDKINSSTIDGVTTVRNDNAPEPEKGESNRAFITRLFQKNLAASQSTGQVRK